LKTATVQPIKSAQAPPPPPQGEVLTRNPDEPLNEDEEIMYTQPHAEIPVRLIITEILNSQSQKTLRSLLSPITSAVPSLSQEFGMFHTALVVGPWYIEWTDSSLCIPRKIHSGAAILSADVDPVNVSLGEGVENSLTLMADKLADIICEWNIAKIYKNYSIGTKKENEANCQEFVDTVLAAMNTKINVEGAFKDFVSKMKTHGKCELEYEPGPDVIAKCKLESKVYKFQSHKELDEFALMISKSYPFFKMEFKHDWRLLKAFDRAFWLRHFKQPKDDAHKPLYGGPYNELLCPFKDPLATSTFMRPSGQM